MSDHYFKNAELAKQYHVSPKTVYNWIDAAKQGKLDLELYEEAGRVYIANKQRNVVVLRQLAQEGKKYRNARFHKIITPKPEFYEQFSRQQILDIMTSLSTRGEIPRQYNYFAEGATSWDEVMQRDAKTVGLSNILKGTQELIHINLEAIDRLIAGHSKINVVDVGPGNAMPVRELLEHLIERDVLHRYIAIDISQDMLRIAERNLRDWFGSKIPFEGHIRDINYQRFQDVLVDDLLKDPADRPLNLMLFLGDTHENFPSPSDPLKTVYGSMDEDALVVFTNKPDTETSRRYFEFNSRPGASKVSPTQRLVLDLLGITEDLYDLEMGYDERRRMRYVRVRLNTAITVRFRFEGGSHEVSLEKDSTILLLRVWHRSAVEFIEMYQKVGLKLLQSSMTKDRNFLLTIFGVEEEK